MSRVVIFTVLIGISLAGCGRKRAEDTVSVSGRVTFANGQPVKDVILTLQPIEAGLHPVGFKLNTDGSFSGEAAPGKYAYYFSEGEAKGAVEKERFEAAFKGIPEAYRTADMERTIKVGGDNLHIQLN